MGQNSFEESHQGEGPVLSDGWLIKTRGCPNCRPLTDVEPMVTVGSFPSVDPYVAQHGIT